MENVASHIFDALSRFKKPVNLNFYRRTIQQDMTYKWQRFFWMEIAGQFIALQDNMKTQVSSCPTYESEAVLLVQDEELFRYNAEIGYPADDVLILAKSTPVIHRPDLEPASLWGVLSQVYYQENGNLYKFAFNRIKPQALAMFDNFSIGAP